MVRSFDLYLAYWSLFMQFILFTHYSTREGQCRVTSTLDTSSPSDRFRGAVISFSCGRGKFVGYSPERLEHMQQALSFLFDTHYSILRG